MLALAFAAWGQSIPRFAPSTTYSVPGADMAVLADVNGDGKLDIITANGYAPNPDAPGLGGFGVSLLLGNGDGTFQPARAITSTGNPMYVVVRDFDGDGKPDLILDDGPGTTTISFLKGNGDGTFLAPVKIPIATDPTVGGFNLHGNGSIIAEDFNGDGKPDLAVSYVATVIIPTGSFLQPTVKVLLNDGHGNFHITNTITRETSSTGTTMYAADLNGDGITDLLFADALQTVELGNGDGTFREDPTNVFNQLAAWNESVIGDFNGDGVVDAATIEATSPRAGFAYFVNLSLGHLGSVFFTNLPGFFPVVQSTNVGADFNGDGLLDFAGTNVVYYNLGNGQFQPVFNAFDFGKNDTSMPAGTTFPQRWLVTGDLDGNGSPDLVSTEDGRFVQVALNTGGNPPLLASFGSDSTAVVTGTRVLETVSLGSKAPIGGAVVTLSSNSPSAVVPASVTVAAGVQSVKISVKTTTGATATPTILSASYRGTTLKTNLLVVPHFSLSAISVAPSSLFGMAGGNAAVGTLTLTGPAADGTVVTLASSNPAALLTPASVTVPAGATSVTFPLSAQFVATDTAAIVSAAFGGLTKTASVTVKKEIANITITKAEFAVNKKLLNVEGTTTSTATRVNVYDKATGTLIGPMSVIRGKFTGQLFSPAAAPITSIIVQTTLDEAATSAVAQK